MRNGSNETMLRPTLLVVLLLIRARVDSAAEPLSYVPRTNKPLDILGVSLFDGGVVAAIADAKKVDKENPSLPQLPPRAYIHCVWDGNHLRIRPGEVDKRMWSKDAIAKNGWYLTADYTTDPPRVIVTEKPAAGSVWRFVAVSIRDEYYIKNEGSSGKAAWLTHQPRQTVYRGVHYGFLDPQGRKIVNYWEYSVTDAVLTFDDAKKKFRVADVEAENGK